MAIFRFFLRLTAYMVAVLLALVWITAAVRSFASPLLDIGQPTSGRAILAAADVTGLNVAGTFALARMLAGAKLALGVLLLCAPLAAIAAYVREGTSDDALLDVALLYAAIGSLVAGFPVIAMGAGEPLQAVMGEFILCVIAHALAAQGRKPRQPRALAEVFSTRFES